MSDNDNARGLGEPWRYFHNLRQISAGSLRTQGRKLLAGGFESLIDFDLHSFGRNFLVQIRLELPLEILPGARVITLITVYDRGYDQRVVSDRPLSAKVSYPCKKPDSKHEHPCRDWNPRFNRHHFFSMDASSTLSISNAIIRNGSRKRRWDTTARRCIGHMRYGR